MEIFRDPVVAPSGRSYERTALLEHLKKVGGGRARVCGLDVRCATVCATVCVGGRVCMGLGAEGTSTGVCVCVSFRDEQAQELQSCAGAADKCRWEGEGTGGRQ